MRRGAAHRLRVPRWLRIRAGEALHPGEQDEGRSRPRSQARRAVARRARTLRRPDATLPSSLERLARTRCPAGRSSCRVPRARYGSHLRVAKFAAQSAQPARSSAPWPVLRLRAGSMERLRWPRPGDCGRSAYDIRPRPLHSPVLAAGPQLHRERRAGLLASVRGPAWSLPRELRSWRVRAERSLVRSKTRKQCGPSARSNQPQPACRSGGTRCCRQAQWWRQAAGDSAL